MRSVTSRVALLAALCLDVARAADSNDSSTTIIYVVVGVVVLLFVGVGVFLWQRSRSSHKSSPANELPLHDTVAASLPSSSQQQQHPPRSNDYRAHASPAGRHGPSTPPFQADKRVTANPNAPPPPSGPPAPRRPITFAHQRPQRTSETAARVLAEIQADPDLSRLKIPYSSIYFTRVLSKGAFGEVWLAQLANRQVAVKRILNEKRNDEKEIECFAAEIKLMALFHHPKIVEFVGVSWNTLQDLCAVTEYMVKGDLYGFLKRKAGMLNWGDHKIYLAEDVAEALSYLHALSPMVIHRDLKSKNILLDDTFRAKLSDFGISRQRFNEETMTVGVGTIYWTAPEVLTGKKYTEKADIYSFGIVMSELDTHKVPYWNLRDEAGRDNQGMKIVKQVINNKLRPQLNDSCPADVRALTARCLDEDPNARPDAMELLRLIQEIQTRL
jgi:hypothetical protein